MIKKRLEGNVQIIYNLDNSYLEEIALGVLTRAMGHSYKIALITKAPHSKLFTFLENLCISQKFVKQYERLHVETFNLRQTQIQRGILPQVEFQTIPYDKLLSRLYSFDYIIFLNPNEEILHSPKFQDFLVQKQDETEIVILLNERPSNQLKKIADSIYSIKYSKNSALTTNTNTTLILNSAFSELYSYGYLIKKFIEKKNVKLIAFERGDLIYGEVKFFRAIKQFCREYIFYGTFDFVYTGLPRIKGPQLRSTNTIGDLAEAKEGIMLAKTALKKLTPVIIDNIEKLHEYSLTKGEEIDIFRLTTNEVLVPIKNQNEQTKNYRNYAGDILEFIEEKPPEHTRNRLKKGIDF
jgi:ATP:corrinoid adenosyltransferase